jgi:hypothetical protein
MAIGVKRSAEMTFKMIVKLLACFFIPTTLLGVFYLFENKFNVHGTVLGLVIEILLVPVYLATVGNLFIMDNNIEKLPVKLLIIFLSVLATIHGIHMMALSYDVWQHVLCLPNALDGISKMVLNIILGSSLGVLLISYPITSAIISKIRG